MATVKEMAEAHLLNVQREIQNLSQRRSEIDKEIETLNTYLVEVRLFKGKVPRLLMLRLLKNRFISFWRSYGK